VKSVEQLLEQKIFSFWHAGDHLVQLKRLLGLLDM
jgi:hypothetical protein